jgi:hypothetical protein
MEDRYGKPETHSADSAQREAHSSAARKARTARHVFQFQSQPFSRAHWAASRLAPRRCTPSPLQSLSAALTWTTARFPASAASAQTCAQNDKCQHRRVSTQVSVKHRRVSSTCKSGAWPCPGRTPEAASELSQGQPFARAHCSTSRCPPRAACASVHQTGARSNETRLELLKPRFHPEMRCRYLHPRRECGDDRSLELGSGWLKAHASPRGVAADLGADPVAADDAFHGQPRAVAGLRTARPC